MPEFYSTEGYRSLVLFPTKGYILGDQIITLESAIAVFEDIYECVITRTNPKSKFTEILVKGQPKLVDPNSF